MRTPWGQAQNQVTLAKGIIEVSTLSHGGIRLDASRRAQLPEWAKGDNWLKSEEWWEEDCDWCVPFLYFLAEIKEYMGDRLTEYYNPGVEAGAMRTAKEYHPEFYRQMFGS